MTMAHPAPTAHRVLLIVDGGELLASSDCCGGLADDPTFGATPPPGCDNGKVAIQTLYRALSHRPDVAVDVVDQRNLFFLLPTLMRRMGVVRGLSSWLTLRAPAVFVDDRRRFNGLADLAADPGLSRLSPLLDGPDEP